MYRHIVTFMLAIAAALTSVAVTPAAAQPTTPAPTVQSDEAAAPLSEGYVLGIGDVVEVSVLGREEFRPRVQVQADGTIQLPFLGSVGAADMTVLQFRDKVRRELMKGGYYADPVVNVAVASYASRYVTVLGEVTSPGIVPVDRSYRVSEILARVGGPRAGGADIVKITRSNGEELELSIEKIATGGPAEDPAVSPGDKIFIPEAKTFYIYGQVAAPGTYPIDRDMTLRKALARGGGLTDMGSEKRVKVYRKGEKLDKFDPSSQVLDGDVIVVGERFF